MTLLAAAPGPAADPPPPAERLLAAARASRESYSILQHLTDRVGPRLSGSPGAGQAVAWTLERLRADGLEARAEAVRVPHWVRGTEEGEVVAPVSQRLVVTALGGSEPTPAGGLTAEVVEVGDFETLRALSASAVEAAQRGAVASLVRSLGTASMRLPHTGALDYQEGVKRIPAAAVTAEDADLLHRLLVSGPVRVKLELGGHSLPEAESANVVADLRGRERPQEVVLIGAHLDSWDLGTGAIDDGAGVAMVMEALRLMKSLGLQPRRTVRGVLFMNEENGGRGGKGYLAAHASELGQHVAAIESDSGAGPPHAWTLSAGAGGLDQVRKVAALLEPLGASTVTEGGDGGADIAPLRAGGVPLLGLRQDDAHYFDWHHTAADTLDKVDPSALAANAAALAVMAYELADRPDPLSRLPPASSPAP